MSSAAGILNHHLLDENVTNREYDRAVVFCKEIFLSKTKDYGTSWRVLRPISIADQIYIKAQRIRNLQMVVEKRVPDSITSEFRGMVNYGIIALIQDILPEDAPEYLSVEEAERYYDEQLRVARTVMLDKNHDYGEAWRAMSQESFTDLILMKILRIRQILANEGKTIMSEGIDANFVDIINYAVFALILIDEGKHKG